MENPVQNVEKPTLPDHKIVGEALRLYIIVELDGELLLIDKHAAHERMIFDRLKSQDPAIMAQTLLESVTLRLTEEDKELLEANAELLNELGFEIEPFGESDYILRAVPADMESSDAAAAVEESMADDNAPEFPVMPAAAEAFAPIVMENTAAPSDGDDQLPPPAF